MVVLQHADVSGMHALTEQLLLWSLVQATHQPTVLYRLMPEATPLGDKHPSYANHATSISTAAAPQASLPSSVLWSKHNNKNVRGILQTYVPWEHCSCRQSRPPWRPRCPWGCR